MIRALQVRSSAGLYGPERSLLEGAPPLRERGVAPRFLALYRRPPGGPARHPWLREAEAAGIETVQVEDPAPLSRPAARAAWRAFRAPDVDLLHSHDYKADLLAALLRRPRPPWLATLHLHTAATPRLRLYRRLGLLALRRAERVVCVSRAQAEELAARGMPAARLALVPTVVDADALAAAAPPDAVRAARAELGLAPDAPLVLFAGRLARQKGADLLLDAWPAVLRARPSATLVLAGDGPERAALEGLAAATAPEDAVRFLGYRRTLAPLWAAADVVALPSRDEGMPRALLEAMALARPVVTTPVGGIPEVLGASPAARLVPPEDAAALSAAIVALLREPAAARALGEAAADRVRAAHAPGRAADALAALYRELLA